MSRPVPGARRAAPMVALLLITAILSGTHTTAHAQAGDPFTRVEAQLPGPLLSATVVRLEDGTDRLAVLAGPPREEETEDGEDPPKAEPAEELRTLLLIDPGDRDREPMARVATLAEGLPETARRLTALPREGAGDLIAVVTRGGAVLIDPERAAGDAADPADLEGTVLLPDGLSSDRSGLLAVARPGTLELYSAGPDGTLGTAATLSLPKRAERTRWGLRITSPPIHRIDGAGTSEPNEGARCWAVGPEAHGQRRLRTLLYCADQEEPVEIWSLLPEGETVTETLYTRYGDRPMLVVLTRTKLGLFVKQRLRLFPLEASRNRVGSEPILAVETACPLWRGSSLGFADVDGDGRDDLSLVCKKGLVDQELRLEVYRGLGGGTFEEKGRDLELDGDYSSWSFEHDWTGDGLPDLLAVREGVIELHPATGNRRRPVDRNASRIIDLRSGAAGEEEDREVHVKIEAGSDGREEVTVRLGGPRILGTADLTGDDRPELVVYRGGTPGGRITILERR